MPIACAAGTGALAGIAFAWIAGCMAAHAAPEPPRRPADVKADQPSSKPSSTGARTRRAGQIIVNDAAALRLLPSTPSKRANCVARLERLGPRIQPVTLGAEKNDSCVIEIPVRLTSLKLTEQEIEVSVHRPVLACGFAEQFGTWVRDLTAPFVQARLAPLKAVRTGPGSCAATVTIKPVASSAHAVGLAVDIAAFELANAETISVAEDKASKKSAVLATMQTAARGWFTTILGPGSDAAHATHWHLDIQRHG